MRRVAIRERADWKDKANKAGFVFHTMDGKPYWDESAYYAFTMRQVEDHLESATNEIIAMCQAALDKVCANQEAMERLRIPRFAWDYVARSWQSKIPTLYGRLDFSYDGVAPPKLLEYNADTPTSLYESAVFQWYWLEDLKAKGTLPGGADQFNSIHDKLIAAFQSWGKGLLHLASVPDEIEDRGTVAYLEDCARQAGLETSFIAINEIGLSSNGAFVDAGDQPIQVLFKLYPWEWLFAEEFGKHIPKSPTHFVEPAWKSILSNKGILPILWELAPGHPNLLPAYFEDDPRKSEIGTAFARKPLFSREGANVLLVDGTRVIDQGEGPYGGEGYIRQALCPLPKTNGNYAVIGSWIIAEESAGIGIREDISPITKNNSRFLPHAIID
jgi:glutathionylspermidine synthase